MFGFIRNLFVGQDQEDELSQLRRRAAREKAEIARDLEQHRTMCTKRIEEIEREREKTRRYYEREIELSERRLQQATEEYYASRARCKRASERSERIGKQIEAQSASLWEAICRI